MPKFTDIEGNTCWMSKGRKGSIPNTTWRVFTTKDNEFIEIGIIEVNGEFVRNEMNTHNSIKDYEPHDIAENLAHQKFPNANPIIVEQIYGATKKAHKKTKV